MLRTKQLSSLSSCARTLLYSGTRCNTSDGSSTSSACPEDEKHISSKIHRTDASILPKAPTLASKGDGQLHNTKPVNSHKSDVIKQLPSPPQVATVPVSVGGSGHVHSSIVLESDLNDSILSSSPNIADRLVKAGITTVAILSDLVNYKLPLSDGGGTLSQAHNYMVAPARPQPPVQATILEYSRNDSVVHTVSQKPSPAGDVATPVNDSSFKGKSSNPLGPQRGFHHVKSTTAENRAGTDDTRTLEKKPNIRQRRRVHTNNYTSSHPNHNFQKSETRFVRSVSQHLTHRTGSSMNTRQYASASQVVGSMLDTLTRFKWGPQAVSALEGIGFSFDAYQANQVLKQIQDYSTALGFFHWLKRKPGFKHDEHTYTTMIGILGRSRQFDEINNLLDEMFKVGCRPNVVTYNRMIHSYGRANYLNKALEIFHQMQEAGCEPDRVTYCTLIDIHAKAGFLDVAMYIYQRMLEAGLFPDTLLTVS